MKTLTLKKLHNRSIKELELIEKGKNQKESFNTILKSKRINSMNYWSWSVSELEFEIKKLNEIEKRLYIWYIQTLNKIMRYSN